MPKSETEAIAVAAYQICTALVFGLVVKRVFTIEEVRGLFPAEAYTDIAALSDNPKLHHDDAQLMEKIVSWAEDAVESKS